MRTPAPERHDRLSDVEVRTVPRGRARRAVRGKCAGILGLLGLLLPIGMTAQVFDGEGLGAGIGAAGGELAGTGVITANPNLILVIGRFIKFILPYIGALALLALIVAGFFLILGFGTEESIGRAKKIVTWSLIGIIVVLLSYPVVNFIIGFA